MKVSDIMTKEVIAVQADTLITEVAEIMTRERIHAVPVIDEGKKVIGIITESNFFSKSSPASLYFPTVIDFMKTGKLYEVGGRDEWREVVKNALAKDIMTTPCAVVQDSADAQDFIKLVREREFTSVPVVNSNAMLVGIVTVADVLKFL